MGAMMWMLLSSGSDQTSVRFCRFLDYLHEERPTQDELMASFGTTLIMVEADNQIRSLQLPARMLQTIFLNTASALSLSQFRGVAKRHRHWTDYVLNTL
ncbi:hypothetical protein N7449_006260 [Penicillium cf. viridicatum]|uniref:Uncharacterized protein n=1 Tax=Penicillium cf. viridicatum TaxID=2972119 RepID=A0A9W9JK48_9EURO|nr:hypothetical protein N7449_006260 [Penicillium cf. viridicatum]